MQVFVGQVVAGLLSVIGVAKTAQFVGPKIFGFASISLVVCTVFVSFADFGACSWAAREFASSRINIRTYFFVMKSKGRINLCILIFLPIFFFFFPHDLKWICLLSMYPFLWNRFNYVQQLLISTERIREAVFLMIADRLCWLLIFPLAALNFSRDLAFVLPILIGLIFQNFLSQRFMSESNEIQDQTQRLKTLELFVKSRHYGIIGISGVVSNLDSFAVGIVSSLESSGTYALGQRLRNPLSIVFNSIVIRIKPIAARRIHSEIVSSLKADLRLIWLGVVSILAISLLALRYADNVFGFKYEGIEEIMAIGTLSSLPFGFVLISTGLLSAIGLEKYVSRTHWYYSAALLFSVIWGVNYYGSLGGVVGSFSVICVYAVTSSIKLKQELEKLS